MRDPGRLSAAIEILEEFERRRTPLKTAIADWARGARYAGAKDRAWISGLCLDVLRKRNSLAWAMGGDSARLLALGALRFLWGMPVEDLSLLAAEEPHGPGPLSGGEKNRLANPEALLGFAETGVLLDHRLDADAAQQLRADLPAHVLGDYPDWLAPYISRVFGRKAAAIMPAFARRADIDLRVNTLKTTPDKALVALRKIKGEEIPLLATAARIAAPPANLRAPAVSIIPAFNKGWLEVQDLGSQIAAAAAGDIKGAQLLDYCAGGGGKTLALAAMMENTGQLYAYDCDPRRLKPLYHRAKRAGLRNLQIRSPAGDEGRDDLIGKMDVVFVDAPCSGAGTWRRHPDTKWRLTPKQLERRQAEQDQVLKEAADFVKPGGRMVYVTCSFLMEENEDRLSLFLKSQADFALAPTLAHMEKSGLLTDAGRTALEKCLTPQGAIRLTPDNIVSDGFFIAVMKRRAA